MSEDMHSFDNLWEDKIELHKEFVKLRINEGKKYSLLGDSMPEHVTGIFEFRYDQLESKMLTFLETSYSLIHGRKYGYIGITNVRFPFDSNNRKWQRALNLIRE
ncbi:hypothetical protein OAI71_01535, partial [Marine Group III euryarchaeote]|nr:hypothetical protein [Marine Group III euryarchaeote]